VGRAGHLSLERRRVGDATVLSARGDIDLSTFPRLAAALDSARAGPPPRGDLILDLRAVDFMDTSGLRLVIEEQQRAAAEGYRFAVFRGSPKVQRLFEIAGLARVQELFVDPSTVFGDGEAG
jgi:anti-sigma B factor antagonist